MAVVITTRNALGSSTPVPANEPNPSTCTNAAFPPPAPITTPPPSRTAAPVPPPAPSPSRPHRAFSAAPRRSNDIHPLRMMVQFLGLESRAHHKRQRRAEIRELKSLRQPIVLRRPARKPRQLRHNCLRRKDFLTAPRPSGLMDPICPLRPNSPPAKKSPQRRTSASAQRLTQPSWSGGALVAVKGRHATPPQPFTVAASRVFWPSALGLRRAENRSLKRKI